MEHYLLLCTEYPQYFKGFTKWRFLLLNSDNKCYKLTTHCQFNGMHMQGSKYFEICTCQPGNHIENNSLAPQNLQLPKAKWIRKSTCPSHFLVPRVLKQNCGVTCERSKRQAVVICSCKNWREHIFSCVKAPTRRCCKTNYAMQVIELWPVSWLVTEKTTCWH